MSSRDEIASESSTATRRPAARLAFRFSCTDERAGDLALELRRDAIDVESRAGEKRTRVFNLVHAPGFDIDVDKTSGLQLGRVLEVAKCAGDTTNPQLHAPADVGRDRSANNHI